MKRLFVALASIALTTLPSAVYALDGRGLTDGSVYDHRGVSPYEPRRSDRSIKRRAKLPPDDDYKYALRCYWTTKTTDGWWPTGATQVCVRERVE